MISNPLDGITCPSLPTLSDIQRRIAELAGIQQQIDAQAQVHSRSAPRTPPPPSVPPHPILSEAALYGVAGMAVRALAPHTEAHPAAILLQLLAVFGNAVGPAPRHIVTTPASRSNNVFSLASGRATVMRCGGANACPKLTCSSWIRLRISRGC
jgi:hypothetical protein